MWEPKQAYDEESWTEDYLEQVLSSHARLPLPPYDQHIGATHVRWEEIEPGSFAVHAHGGSLADTSLARYIVASQLEAYGLRKAEFIPFPAERTASYDDVEAKAKRYWQGGAVDVKVNTANEVAGVVDADTGTYEPEFSRNDPNSGSITTWKCTCPWDQFAWQRTRKWKYLEGRPCAHVLALYWASMATPVDQEFDPAAGGATVGPSGQLGFGDSAFQRTQTPTGQPSATPAAGAPAQQLSIPGIIPGQADAAPPVPGPSVIPPFQGYPVLPAPVSVPGGKPPSAENPIQYPGGTWSSVRTAQYPLELEDWVHMSAAQTFQNSDMVRINHEDDGIAEGKSEAHGAGQFRTIPKNSIGEVMGQDPTTGWVEVIFAIHDTGPMEPYHVRCFLDPSSLTPMPGVAKPGPFITRR